jgi:hypothetical protein
MSFTSTSARPFFVVSMIFLLADVFLLADLFLYRGVGCGDFSFTRVSMALFLSLGGTFYWSYFRALSLD